MLNTIIVDDSQICMEMLLDVCKNRFSLNLKGFTEPIDALKYTETNCVQLAFLDIDMPAVNGIDLGQLLRNINPDIILIYISSKKESCFDAMLIKADGFIPKPFHVYDIEYAVNRAVVLATNQNHYICGELADTFKLIIGQNVVHFSNSRSNDLLALCTAREGQPVSTEEAIKTLWPDRIVDDKTKRLYRKVTSNIRDTLREYTDTEIFCTARGCCYINPKNIHIRNRHNNLRSFTNDRYNT
ncbi:MAG: response regulator [Lachnospiraceae bacterium]|nr:response regulator [Lachnospiraceae bacterium]